MRARWVLVALVVALLAVPNWAVAEEGGGIDPRLPDGLYPNDDFARPVVTFKNETFEKGTENEIVVNVENRLGFDDDFTLTLEIYSWAVYGNETLTIWDFDDYGPHFNDGTSNGSWRNRSTINITIGKSGNFNATVVVPEDAILGYYRVRLNLKWSNGSATSRGHFLDQDWETILKNVGNSRTPKAPYLIDEAGFTVVEPGHNYIRTPNLVPDLGDFTTPVIKPGESGTYNFTVTNRYAGTMNNTELMVEIYMWATIEEARELGKVGDPVPFFEEYGGTSAVRTIGDLAPGASHGVRLVIGTDGDTLKGTYFVRHRLTFEYDGVEFTMASRGYYSSEQWEGFDYSNLYYQLDGSSGIIPDSSFSVKDPVPLWPLAALIGLCVLFGALAVVFYLAEEHGSQYPRLKRGLQFWTGRWEQRKRLMQQRMDDLRGEEWDAGDDAVDGKAARP